MKKIRLFLVFLSFCYSTKSQTIFSGESASAEMSSATLSTFVDGNEDTIIVSFQYTELVFTFWFDPASLLESEGVIFAPTDSISSVEITGLEPGKIYYFRAIDNNGTEGPIGMFNTHSSSIVFTDITSFLLIDACLAKLTFTTNITEPFVARLKFGDESGGVLISQTINFPDGLVGEGDFILDFFSIIESGGSFSDTVIISLKMFNLSKETISWIRGQFVLKSKDCEEEIFGLGFRKTQEKSIDIYPNPTSGFINFNNDNFSIVEIENLSGVIRLSSFEKQVDVRFLPAGLYLVKFLNQERKVISTQKLIKI